jgi:hypothetical protein
MLVLSATLAVVCAGSALAYKPTIVKVGNLPPVEINGGWKPTKLPKKKLAPVHFELSDEIAAPYEPNPPALKELIVEVDKNTAVDARGLARCTFGKLAAATTAGALKACKPALVGEGRIDIVVAFPEQSPLPVPSKLLAFNGGLNGGKTTIYVFAFLATPVAEAFVATVKIAKIHDGRYGPKWVMKVPSIADGSGTVRKFELELFRQFTYKGKKRSYLLARCADGKLIGRWEEEFVDGSERDGHFARPCTPRG